MRKGHVSAVMGILRQAALNTVRTIQQNFRSDVSIMLLRDRLGCHPWILASPCPDRDCAFALPPSGSGTNVNEIEAGPRA